MVRIFKAEKINSPEMECLCTATETMDTQKKQS